MTCTSTWTGCPLSGCKAAGHLLLSRHEVLPGEFLGCRHRSEHEQEVREGIQERRTGQRKERPERGWSARCWTCRRFRRVVCILGRCSSASLPLGSASISTLLVHDGAGNVGLLDARLANIIVHHGALRARVYRIVGVPRDDAIGQRLGVDHHVVPGSRRVAEGLSGFPN